jgi:hypothetical protein
MKISAYNVQIRPWGTTTGSNAIVQRHLAAGLDIKVLDLSAAEFDLALDNTPTEARNVVGAVERFITEEARSAFPFPLFPFKPNRRTP